MNTDQEIRVAALQLAMTRWGDSLPHTNWSMLFQDATSVAEYITGTKVVKSEP